MSNEEFNNMNTEVPGAAEAVPTAEVTTNENPASAAPGTDPIPPRRLPVGRQLGVLALLLVGMFGLGAAPNLYALLQSQNNTQLATDLADTITTPATQNADPFANLVLRAQSVVVFDVRNDTFLYEKDAKTSRPLASVTKLMTGLVAKELIAPGENIVITTDAVSQDGDSGLRAGENFRYQGLSDLTLLTSSNDGAYALAAAAGQSLDTSDPAAAFVKAMNIRATELGLTETYFRNPTGLDLTETESGAYGSANDMAKLLAYIIDNHPELLEATTVDSDVVYNNQGERHLADNTNRVVNSIPGLIGSKTGYTELAGGNLAVAFDAGVDRPIVVVVLGSSHQGRFADVLQLVQATRDKLKD